MMKNIVIIIFLSSISLNAGESTIVQKSDSFSRVGIDGKVLYEKRCAKCHGKNAKKTPLKSMVTIAGLDAGVLARTVRAYRDQEERHGAYAIYKTNLMMKEATSSLSNRQISAVAVYVSGLR